MKSSRKSTLSTSARADLRALLQYSVSTWGERQLDAYAEAIHAAIDELASFPALGRARDDIFPGCRSYPAEQHIIYYHRSGNAVTIDRICTSRWMRLRLSSRATWTNNGEERPAWAALWSLALDAGGTTDQILAGGHRSTAYRTIPGRCGPDPDVCSLGPFGPGPAPSYRIRSRGSKNSWMRAILPSRIS